MWRAGGGRELRRNAMRRLRASLAARQQSWCYLETSSARCEEGPKGCKDKYTIGGGVAPVGEAVS